jgi:hypothetical protein
MVCMILCYLYDVPSRKYRNEQYNIENFGVLMCPLSILIFFFFFFLGPFGVPLGLLAYRQCHVCPLSSFSISIKRSTKHRNRVAIKISALGSHSADLSIAPRFYEQKQENGSKNWKKFPQGDFFIKFFWGGFYHRKKQSRGNHRR